MRQLTKDKVDAIFGEENNLSSIQGWFDKVCEKEDPKEDLQKVKDALMPFLTLYKQEDNSDPDKEPVIIVAKLPLAGDSNDAYNFFRLIKVKGYNKKLWGVKANFTGK